MPATPRQPRRPRAATYRVQLHAGFSFDDAAAIAGVSRRPRRQPPVLLAVPAGRARQHARLRRGRPQPAQRRARRRGRPRAGWPGALADAGLGQVLDIVPNHMALAGRANAWWWDVLENGPSSRYARYFDIDWDPPERKLTATVLMPVLGDHYGRVLEAGELARRAPGRLVRRPLLRPRGARCRPARWTICSAGRRARAGSAELDGLADRVRRAAARRPAPTRSPSAERHQRQGGAARRAGRAVRGTIRRWPAAIDAEIAALNTRSRRASTRCCSRQNYRLAYWRTAARGARPTGGSSTSRRWSGCGWRTTTVFADTHRLVLRAGRRRRRSTGCGSTTSTGCADPAGLPGPAARRRPAAPTSWWRRSWRPDEELPGVWPVAGTTRLRLPEPGRRAVRRPGGERPMRGLLRPLHRRGRGLRRGRPRRQAADHARRAGGRAGAPDRPARRRLRASTGASATTPAGSCATRCARCSPLSPSTAPTPAAGQPVSRGRPRRTWPPRWPRPASAGPTSTPSCSGSSASCSPAAIRARRKASSRCASPS